VTYCISAIPIISASPPLHPEAGRNHHIYHRLFIGSGPSRHSLHPQLIEAVTGHSEHLLGLQANYRHLDALAGIVIEDDGASRLALVILEANGREGLDEVDTSLSRPKRRQLPLGQ
jgi:hypothetical protein